MKTHALLWFYTRHQPWFYFYLMSFSLWLWHINMNAFFTYETKQSISKILKRLPSREVLSWIFLKWVYLRSLRKLLRSNYQQEYVDMRNAYSEWLNSCQPWPEICSLFWHFNKCSHFCIFTKKFELNQGFTSSWSFLPNEAQ